MPLGGAAPEPRRTVALLAASSFPSLARHPEPFGTSGRLAGFPPNCSGSREGLGAGGGGNRRLLGQPKEAAQWLTQKQALPSPSHEPGWGEGRGRGAPSKASSLQSKGCVTRSESLRLPPTSADSLGRMEEQIICRGKEAGARAGQGHATPGDDRPTAPALSCRPPRTRFLIYDLHAGS